MKMEQWNHTIDHNLGDGFSSDKFLTHVPKGAVLPDIRTEVCSEFFSFCLDNGSAPRAESPGTFFCRVREGFQYPGQYSAGGRCS
jgi:hypothetical protein